MSTFGYHTSLQTTLLATVQGCPATALQCYIGGNQTYTRRNFAPADLAAVKVYLEQTKKRFYTHSCLCMNLASGSTKNLVTLTDELRPVLATGGSTVVHIGSKNVNKEPVGTMDKIITTLKALRVPTRTEGQRWPLLLENAAGEGAKFGSTLTDLKYLFALLQDEGIGFCLDTAHAFGAGWCRFASEEEIVALLDSCETELGVGRLQLIHLNDSKIPFGGKNDRHECLGQGHIWGQQTETLRFLLQEARRRGIDVILETPNVLQDYQLGCQLLA